MVRTRVGYAGGTIPNPNYNRIGDYSETVQIDYDPARISYEELLTVFWNSHDPTMQSWMRQYASIIFYHNEEQHRLAVESLNSIEAKLGSKVYTEILPASRFYLAEDYHQKFYLRQVPELAGEFTRIYPDAIDFINSTAAARLNGYAGGNGSVEALKEQIASFGLSEAGEKKLLEIAGRGLSPVCPTL